MSYKKYLLMGGIVLSLISMIGITMLHNLSKDDEYESYGNNVQSHAGASHSSEETQASHTLHDDDYVECLVKTGDNIPSKQPREKWTQEMIDMEKAGSAKQGYIIDCKNSSWNNGYWNWGTEERNPAKFMIVQFPKSEFNSSWLEPEYDKDGNIILLRKYRLPLENVLSQQEMSDVKNIEYNSKVSWHLNKNVTDIGSKIVVNDYDAVNHSELVLHGSSGTFTVCPSGCNYNTLANWEAGEDADLTSSGPCIANITEGFIDTGAVDISGWTTTEDDYIKILTAPGTSARHNGMWTSSAYMLNLTDGFPIKIAQDYVKIEGLQIEFSCTFGALYVGIEQSASNIVGTSIDKTIIRQGYTGDSSWGIDLSQIGGQGNITNSIISGFGDAGKGGLLISGTSSIYVYNTLVYDNAYGIYTHIDATGTIKNCVALDNADDFFQGDTLDHCASDDGSGTNAINMTALGLSWDDQFVDYANGDYHLLQGSVLIDSGTTLNQYFNDDIDGDKRDYRFDIGVDEYNQSISFYQALSPNPIDANILTPVSVRGQANWSNGTGLGEGPVNIYFRDSLYAYKNISNYLSNQTAWWNSSYKYRKEIRINHTQIDQDISNFTMVVLLNQTNFDFSHSNTDGNDIRFINESLDLLPYERVKHNATSMKAEYWVKVPQVHSDVDTVLYMYYTTDDKTDGANPDIVWDNNFIAVYHMDEASPRDSSAYGNDATGYGTNVVSGIVDTALKFEQGNNDYVDVADGGVSDFDITGSFTIMFWVQCNLGGDCTNVGLVGKWKNNVGYLTILDASGRPDAYLDAGNGNALSPDAISLTTTWHHIVAVFDLPNTDLYIYVDGKLKAVDTTATTVTASNDPFEIGRYAGSTTVDLGGNIDEVRVSNRTRGSAWINASYRNQNSTHSQFLSIQNEEQRTFTNSTGGFNYVFSLNLPAGDYEILTNTTRNSYVGGNISILSVAGVSLVAYLNISPVSIAELLDNNVSFSGNFSFVGVSTQITYEPIGIYFNHSLINVSYAWNNVTGQSVGEAPWWNDSFRHRHEVIINRTNPTNYMFVPINFSTSDLINMSYINENCTNIRFSDVDALHELPYFVVNNTCNTPSTQFMVWLNYTATNNEVHAYYHNLTLPPVYYDSPDSKFILYLSFANSTGNLTYDSSGNGNSFNLTNSSTSSPRRVSDGRYGYGLDFERDEGDYLINSSLASDFKIGLDNVSIGAWIKLESVGLTQTIFMAGYFDYYLFDIDTSNHVGLGVSDQFLGDTFAVRNTNVALEAGKWYFVAASWNSRTETINVYVNGNNHSETNSPVDIDSIDLDYPVYISHPTNRLDGIMDEIMVTRRSLSNEEFDILYNKRQFYHLNRMQTVTNGSGYYNYTSTFNIPAAIYEVTANATIGLYYANDSGTVEVTIDSVPPLIYLETPLDDTLNTTSRKPYFYYNVTDDRKLLLNCSLYLDNGTYNGTYGNGGDVPVNTPNQVIVPNISLADDDYYWWINCSDGYNWNSSEKWNISINYSDVIPPTWDFYPPNTSMDWHYPVRIDWNASDDERVDTYFVNDTNFKFDSDGLLENTTILTVFKTYNLNISVNDTSGNINSTIFLISVRYEINVSLTLNPSSVPATAYTPVTVSGHVNWTNGTIIVHQILRLWVDDVEANYSWWSRNYTNRTKIEVYNYVDIQLNNTLVYVNFSTEGLVAKGELNPNCTDLRFADTNHNLLPSTVDTDSCGTSNTVAWVMGNWSRKANTTIYAYYGKQDSKVMKNITWPDTNLIANYHFDNNSAYDESNHIAYDFARNNSLNCNILGCPNWTSNGKLGGAFDFSHDNDVFFSIGKVGYIIGDFAVMAWVKTTNLLHDDTYDWKNPAIVAVSGAAGYNTDWSFNMYKGNLSWWDEFGGAEHFFVSQANISDGAWHLVAAVRNGTKIQLYDNAMYVGSLSSTSNTIGAHTITIGMLYFGINLVMNGTIDEVRIYNRSVSVSEMMLLYNTSNALLENQSALDYFPSTDKDGNYEYTSLINVGAGTHTVKVNITYRNVTGEYSKNLTTYGNIQLSELSNSSVFQRDYNNVSEISFSGTYGAVTPANVEMRILNKSNNAVIVDWTVVDSSPTGGSWSGNMSVPQGGWYYAQIRQSDDTSVNFTGNNSFGAGMLIGGIGQSNMYYMFINGNGVNMSGLSVAYNSFTGWGKVNTDGAATLTNTISERLNIPVALIQGAVSGTSLLASADEGAGHWYGSTTIYNNFIASTAPMYHKLEFVIWAQGETDARGNVGTTTYANTLRAFFNLQLRRDIDNPTNPDNGNLTIISHILTRETWYVIDERRLQEIRDAQYKVIDSENNTYVGSEFYDMDCNDKWCHLTPGSFKKVADRYAQTILYHLGYEDYYRGPKLDFYGRINSTVTYVSVNHTRNFSGGTGLFPFNVSREPNATGFRVYDNGVYRNLTNVSIIDGNTIRLIHEPVTSEEINVTYQYGHGGLYIEEAIPAGGLEPADGVHDNTSLRLPADIGNGTLTRIDWPPLVRLKTPANGNITYTSEVGFNCSGQDYYQLLNFTLYINSTGWHANNSNFVNGTLNSTNFTLNLPSGHYMWNCMVHDNSTGKGWAMENFTFIVDTTIPLIPHPYLESPDNNTLETTTNQPNFYMNVSDNSPTVDCDLWLRNSTDNHSFYHDTYPTFTSGQLMPVNQTLNNGQYNWSVICSDGVNTNSSIWYNITIQYITGDFIAPSFTQYPHNRTLEYYAQSLFTIFNATDETALSVYFLNDTRFNITLYGGELRNSTILGIGVYYVNVSVNDTSNNINSTTININITDTIAPQWSEYPDNLSIPFMQAVKIDANATDYHNISAYYINDTVYFRINSTNGTIENNTLLGARTYHISLSVNDSSLNVNTTLIEINVTGAAGNCDVAFNDTSPLIYLQTFNVSTNCTTSFNLYRNGTAVSNNTVQVLAGGHYNFTVIRDDWQNYTNVRDEELFIISRISASLSVDSSPSWAETYPNEVTITGSGCPTQLECILLRNGTSVSNPDTVTLGAGHYNYTYLNNSGNENYTGGFVEGLLVISRNSSNCDIILNYTSPQTYGITFNVGTNCTTDYALYYNGSMISNNSNYSIASHYNFTVIRNDTLNYTYTRDDSIFILNKASSEVNLLINGTDNTYTHTYGDINITGLMVTPSYGMLNLTQNSTNIQNATSRLQNITNWSVGHYNMTILFAGNENYTASMEEHLLIVTPLLDTEAPTFDQYPHNRTLEYYVDKLDVKVNASDNAAISTYFVNDTVNFNITLYGGELRNNTNLSIGVYYINISVNDTSNNVNSTTININVSDTIAPSWDEYPDNLSIVFGTQVRIDANASDYSNINAYTVNDTTRFWINSTNGTIVNVTPLGAMNYYINLSVTDTSGNMNETLIEINVTKATSSVNLLINGTDGSHVQYEGDVNLTGYIVTPPSGALHLLSNGSALQNGNDRIDYVSIFTEGHYNITILYDGTDNYTQSQEWHLLRVNAQVDTTSPTFDEIPHNRSLEYFSDAVSIYVNASDNVAIDIYFINDTSRFRIDKNTGLFENSSVIQIGVYYVNISVNDTSNNVASFTININVSDTITPAWTSIPSNITIRPQIDSVSADFDAFDYSTLEYFINDTTNFVININSGLLENNTNLTTGYYMVNVSVNDTHGHVISAIFTVNVTFEYTPPNAYGNHTLTVLGLQYEYLPKDKDFLFTTSVHNTSNGLEVSDASCYVTLYNSSGGLTAHEPMAYSATVKEYQLRMQAPNFSTEGASQYSITCESTSQGGYANGVYTVNIDGQAASENSGSIIALAIFSCVFIFVGIYLMLNTLKKRGE